MKKSELENLKQGEMLRRLDFAAGVGTFVRLGATKIIVESASGKKKLRAWDPRFVERVKG